MTRDIAPHQRCMRPPEPVKNGFTSLTFSSSTRRKMRILQPFSDMFRHSFGITVQVSGVTCPGRNSDEGHACKACGAVTVILLIGGSTSGLFS
jgi:hypothetical protein